MLWTRVSTADLAAGAGLTVGRRRTPEQVGEAVNIGEVEAASILTSHVVAGHGAGEAGGGWWSEPVDGVRVRVSPVRRTSWS